MNTKIVKVYYGTDRKPYRDVAHTIPFTKLGEENQGGNNATEIWVNVDNLENAHSIIAQTKLPNGTLVYDLLTETVEDDVLYRVLHLTGTYTALEGKLTIAFSVYDAQAYVEDDEIIFIGTPNLLVNDNFSVVINYSPITLPNIADLTPNIVLQLLALINGINSNLETKVDIESVLYPHVLTAVPEVLDDFLDGTFLLVFVDGEYSLYKVVETDDVKSLVEQEGKQLNSVLADLAGGTIIVKKAEQDKNGNDISDTYETKSDATTHKERTTILETFKNTTVPATYATKSELSAEVSRAEGAEGALDTAKADKATTLSGYGITNAYTKTEADNLLDEKADKSDTYTKTETNNLLGAKADLQDGKVPSSQLPSYVDDVLEYANFASFPATGETGKIYVALDTNKTYRWSGSAYVEISASLALGETSSTAYRGDRGKTAFDHSQLTSGNPHSVTKSNVGLGNVDNTSDVNKPVSTAQQTELNKKANIDGSYELMTVGVAKQLEASLGVTTNDTFIERTTAGSASVSDGVAEIKSIKGMTILGLVANGDLLIPKASPNENYPMGFSYNRATDITLSNGIATFITNPDGTGQGALRLEDTSVFNVNDKYYRFAKLKAVSIPNTIGYISPNNFITGSGEWEFISSISSGNVSVLARIYDTRSSDWTPISVDYIGAINLTKHGLESLNASQVYNLITSNGAYPENMRVLANGGTLENLGITGIKTVGFNQFNGTYARVLVGNEYNVSGTFTALGFTTAIGGDTSEVVLDEDNHFTPTESGYVYVSGSSTDTVINLSWSGYRDSDYEDYWTETRPIDSATYFPTGMKRVKSTYDELLANKAIQRIGSRAYQVGDLTNADVITNGTTTYYILETPIETAISPILNLSYRISDFGTEEWLQAEGNFVAPIYSTIFYQENLRDKLQRLADIQTPSVEADGTFIPQVVVTSGIPTISWQPKDELELPTLPTTPSTTFVLKCIVDESGVPTLSWVSE